VVPLRPWQKNPLDKRFRSGARFRLTLFFVLFFLSIVCLSRWGIHDQNPIAQTLSLLTSSVQSVFSQWVSRGQDRILSWQELMEIQSLADQLRKDNEELKRHLALFGTINSENWRLRRLHGLSDRQSWETLPADVIGRGGEQLRTILVNRGRSSGVAVNQPVITYEGLVGRVYKVQSHASLVLKITDPNSAVGVFVAKTPDEASPEAVRGIVGGHQTLKLVLEPKGGVAIPKGLPVYASSTSTIYPPGLLIGWVSKPLNSTYKIQRRLHVKSAVDFDHIQEVLILTGLHRDEALVLSEELD